jgi:superfamily II DNA or RNA helicase
MTSHNSFWAYLENTPTEVLEQNTIELLEQKAKQSSNTLKTNKKTPKNKKQTPVKDDRLDCNKLEINICQRGIKININDLQKLGIHDKIIKFFTISVSQMGGYIKKVNNHKTQNGYVILPRFGLLAYMDTKLKNYTIINNIKSGTKPLTPFKWTGGFTDNQPIIADHIMKNYFNNELADAGRSGLILNLEAGQGKSYLAAGLIEKIQRKTLIVCHTVSILNQWVKLLTKSYPNNKIAKYFGQLKESGDICVAIINSLLMDKIQTDDGEIESMEFFKQFGYVVFDEIHLYSSQSRKQIYKKVQRKYMLGLSATPDENKDGLDDINTWNCGAILKAEELEGYSVETIPFKGDVSFIKYIGHPEFVKPLINEKMEIINHSGMVNQLCEDIYRLHLIVKIIFELRRSNKNIFVFADRREYLLKIKKHMSIFGIASHNLLNVKDQDNVMNLMGGATAESMEEAQLNSNVILTTYAFMGTGVSIPKMDALILATPRKSKSRQYINRIFRLGGDYASVRKIVDIVDWSTHMKSQWYLRKKYYDEKKYPITEKKVKWSEIDTEMTEMGIVADDAEPTNELNDAEPIDYAEPTNELNDTEPIDDAETMGEIELSLSELEQLLSQHSILNL